VLGGASGACDLAKTVKRPFEPRAANAGREPNPDPIDFRGVRSQNFVRRAAAEINAVPQQS